MSARTGMYHFEVSRTALYPLAYVLARTRTYHLVLTYHDTRGHGTGFQMVGVTYNVVVTDLRYRRSRRVTY